MEKVMIDRKFCSKLKNNHLFCSSHLAGEPLITKLFTKNGEFIKALYSAPVVMPYSQYVANYNQYGDHTLTSASTNNTYWNNYTTTTGIT